MGVDQLLLWRCIADTNIKLIPLAVTEIERGGHFGTPVTIDALENRVTDEGLR